MTDLASETIQEAPERDDLVLIEKVRKYFPVKAGRFSSKKLSLRAVDEISLTIHRGETLGLVGESGCGKSTLGKLILGLETITSGRIIVEGHDISHLSGSEMKEARRRMQVIFQDPYSSLNPRQSVESIIAEPLIIHGVGTPQKRRARVAQLMEEVGLRSEFLSRYPHEFSGGQRQRIGIARALALNPSLIIADEPVSALDVSIRSQVINLLEDLQDTHNLTYLFISHDLSVVEHISDRVAVMYVGKIVEIGKKDDIYFNPLHPYTEALLSAVPIPDPEVTRRRIILEGDVPSPISPPPGCRFHPRCFLREPICERVEPLLTETGNEHAAACHVRAPHPEIIK